MPPSDDASRSKPQSPLARARLLGASFGHMPRTLGMVWRSSRAATTAIALLTLVLAGLPVAVAWAGKGIVDAVVARSTERALLWVLLELGLVSAQALAQRGLNLARQLLGARLALDINHLILEKALTLELRHFEDAEFYDQLTKARREASMRPVSVVTEGFQLIQNTLTLVGYGALLVRYSPWAAIGLFIAAVPATLAEIRFSRVAFRMRNWRSPEGRRMNYLEYVLATDSHVKEVKLFGLGRMLLDRYVELGERFYVEDRQLAVRRAAWAWGLSLVGTGAFYACYAAMALGAAAARLTLGNLTLYLVAFRQGQQAFQSVLSAIGGMYEDNLYMSNLFEYLAIAAAETPGAQPAATGGGAIVGKESAPAQPAATGGGAIVGKENAPAQPAATGGGAIVGKASAAAQPAATGGGAIVGKESAPAPPAATGGGAIAVMGERGIRFEDVGFRYPNRTEKGDAGRAPSNDSSTEKWALRHVDLFVPRGQSVALVGQNGAGKTTLIKLLTRLYTPTEGRILLDGQDLRAWDEEALRRRIGVIFQDFNEYQLTLRENVGFGSAEHVADDLRVQRAVERGGADAVVRELRGGLEAQLGGWFAKGVELSGGQWQKVALARAFMREEADILVLDEPTAALDAEAEHAVFERFRTLASGRTAFLISHRFPTVRMADRILVMEHGHVLEDGTHAELLAAGRRYAELYRLQAAGYQ